MPVGGIPREACVSLREPGYSITQLLAKRMDVVRHYLFLKIQMVV